MRIEYGATGTSYYVKDYPTGTVSFWGVEESALKDRGVWDGPPMPEPKIWNCEYCGSKHWIKDKRLQCQKCGA